MLRDRTMRVLAALLLGAALLVCVALPALAQDVSPEMRADVFRLLKATGAENVALTMGQAVAGGMVDVVVQQAAMAGRDTAQLSRIAVVVKDEIGKAMVDQMPHLLDEVVPLYARHFTPGEIKGLIAFYESPLGRKATTELPQLMNEATEVGQQWGERFAPELVTLIQKRLEREGLGFE